MKEPGYEEKPLKAILQNQNRRKPGRDTGKNERKSYEWKKDGNERKFKSVNLKSKVKHTQVWITKEVYKTGKIEPGADGFNLSGLMKNVSESEKSELKS